MNFIHNKNQVALYNHTNELIAEVTFPDIDATTVVINRTFVDDSLRGQGIAGQLMQEAALQLRSERKKAALACSYAINWFDKHPEYRDILI